MHFDIIPRLRAMAEVSGGVEGTSKEDKVGESLAFALSATKGKQTGSRCE